jgi:uncharacterized DUF497 family protein
MVSISCVLRWCSTVARRSCYVHREPGEDRWQTTAAVEGRLITVIWTWRGERCRIISARRARDGEERIYRQTYA